MQRTRRFTGFLLVLFTTACGQAAPAFTDADQAAIRAQMERYRQAILSGDWDAWGNTLTDDVIVSPANTAPMTGRQAAVAWGKTFPPIPAFTVNVDEIIGRGDVAFVRGSFEFDMTVGDGATVTERGAFFDIHRRHPDGTWPYARIMFHSTEPLPAAPAATR